MIADDQILACTWHIPLSAQEQDQGMRHHFVSTGELLANFHRVNRNREYVHVLLTANEPF